jgi:STE24 endopeptidase
VLLALTAAEGGARLLAPRDRAIEPAQVDPKAYFSGEQIERGVRFARPQMRLALARGAVELAALAALARVTADRRPAGKRRTGMRRPRWSRATNRPEPPERHALVGGALAASSLAVGSTLLALPLSAIARRRAIAVGLVTQSWRGWALDQLKAMAIESGLSAGAGAALIAVIRRYPRGWWAPAAGGSVAAGALLSLGGPVVLAPLFNDFTPLPEGQTRADVLELARMAGVSVGEVYSVDASRRTTGANAYVTGLGPTKRVVLFDTLLDRYERDQVRVVVAHELAHVRNRDVLRGIGYAAIVAPAAAFAVQRLSWALSAERASGRALPALALAAAVVTAPTGLIGNRLSRAIERRADTFSLKLSGSPDAFISFQRAVALQNVADVAPPRWVSRLLATHPPTLERIGAAVAFSGRPGPAAELD